LRRVKKLGAQRERAPAAFAERRGECRLQKISDFFSRRGAASPVLSETGAG
jgi:hypothetical protein